MTVYADILLLVNLSMDILSLYIVGRVCHKKMSVGRITVASFIGAVSATVLTLFPVAERVMGGVLNIIAGIAVSLIMTRIAFGRPPGVPVLLRDSVILWGGGALIGGIMSFVLSLGEPVIGETKQSYTPTFAVVAAIVLFVVRLFSARAHKQSAEVKITVMSDTYSFTALCDSGSFAEEPISGLPVIIVKSYTLPKIAEELHSPECRLKLRMIPVRGIGGGGLMYGFIPDSICIDGREVSAVVAIDGSRGTYAEQTAIIPSVLCR